MIETVKIRSIEELQNYKKLHGYDRNQVAYRIIKELNENGHDFVLGYCTVCEKATRFKINLNKKNQVIFRETLICEYCKLSNRKRFLLSKLKQLSKDADNKLTVYMYEQITRFFTLSKKLENIDLIGSEFCGTNKIPGKIIENVRHEDAMNLSFESNSFDVIVANDVFEHVPNIQKTLGL